MARGVVPRAIVEAIAMGCALRDRLTFCAIGSRLVFLDLDGDRYFRLSAVAEARFRKVLDATPDCEESGELDYFVDRGLLARTPGSDLPAGCAALPLPEASLIDRRHATNLLTVGRSALSLLRAKWQLNIQPWSRAIEMVTRRARANATACSSEIELAAIAASFEHLGLWLTPLDDCVPRSMALLSQCIASKQPATLVVGVKLDPFAAHCWVQSGSLLLNERVETARTFTPIWLP